MGLCLGELNGGGNFASAIEWAYFRRAFLGGGFISAFCGIPPLTNCEVHKAKY